MQNALVLIRYTRREFSPVVGAVLLRPAPLRFITVLRDSVAGRLRVGASRLGLTAGRLHMTASGLDSAGGSRVGAVAASSAGRGWRVGAILRSVRVGRVGAVAGVVARAVRLVRGVGGGVGDHDRGGLAVTESDGGGLGGVRIRTLGRRSRHSGVDSLGHGDGSRWRAVRGLVDVDCGSGRAGLSDGSDLSRLARVGHSNRADGRAGRWNASDGVGDGRDVRGQDVSDGKRAAVICCSTVCVNRRAVGHERGQGLGHWEGAGRVDNGGLSARNVRGRRLSWSASALARSDSDDAGREASLGLGSRSVCDRACRECSVSCSSFGSRVVFRRRGVASRVWRLATGRVHTTGVRRFAACGVHTTARVRWLAVVPVVRCCRIDRGLIVRSCWVHRGLAVPLTVRRSWVDWRLAVGVAVWCSWVHRRLAPDRAGGARRGRRPARVRVATSGINWHGQRRAAGS
jgi:hypothetical protein